MTRLASAKLNLKRLSARELEIFKLFASSLSSKEVSARCNIGERTAIKHLQNVKDKLAIHDATGLAHFALKAGLVENVFDE